ncbi:MAG: SAM-dependent methyltransferase [Candidatus Cryptobacteroides sp.]
MTNGKLYLIPSPLGENDPKEVIPQPTLQLLQTIKKYVVEESRTVRRYLSKAGLKGHIAELELHELNEHTNEAQVEQMILLFADNHNVGLITEAGLPAIADPGARLVELCHKHNIEVVPMTGPSSLMLALMSSGLNGQSFAFVGYLPAKTEERRNAIKNIEKRSLTEQQTQIFIETPYRNDSLLTDLLSICRTSTKLCIAADLTLDTQFIKTKSISEWKKSVPVIGKRPCVFVILA